MVCTILHHFLPRIGAREKRGEGRAVEGEILCVCDGGNTAEWCKSLKWNDENPCKFLLSMVMKRCGMVQIGEGNRPEKACFFLAMVLKKHAFLCAGDEEARKCGL